MFGFNKGTAERLKRMAAEDKGVSKNKTTVGIEGQSAQSAKGMSVLSPQFTAGSYFVVVPDSDIAAATKSGSVWTLGSGTCKVWKRDGYDEDSQDTTVSVGSTSLEVFTDDETAGNLSVRVFNQTTSRIKAGTVNLAIQDAWGDLYFVIAPPPAFVLYRGISAATLTKGGSAANVNRYTPGTTSTSGTTDSVKNELATIASGKVVYYFDDGSGTLYVVAAECPLT